MAIALVADNVASGARESSQTTTTVTFTAATHVGNFLLLGATQTGTLTLSSISDSRGNTWAVDRVEGGQGPSVNIASCQITIAHQVSDTLTLTFSGASTYSAAIVAEFSGIVTSSALDKVASANHPTNDNPTSGTTVTRTQAAELLYAAVAYNNSGSYTAGTNYTLLTKKQSGAGVRTVQPEYQIVSSVGTDAGIFTGTIDGWGAAIATYKAASVVYVPRNPALDLNM